MGRTIGGTLSGILFGAKRDLDFTLDLVFSDQQFYFATSVLNSLNGHNYTNELYTPSEIKNTLEAPTDGVNLAIQNKDRVLGQHLATYWQKWRTAEAVLGRNYYAVGSDGVRTGTTAWIEMFRGAVEQPNADDSQVTFTLIPDVISPGPIVCVRTCGKNCPHKFKGPACGYSGGETACNHCLASPAGCDGRVNAHRYGGTEHRYDSSVSVPGTGGNVDPPDPILPCPRLDQFVRVKGPDGRQLVKMVCFFTEQDELWDPVEKRFFPTRVARVVKDVPIWQMLAANGARSYTSFSHRRMPNAAHPTGLPVEWYKRNEKVLTQLGTDNVGSSKVALSKPTGLRGDVMFIEMEGGHHYCSGNSPEEMFVEHNEKDGDPIIVV
ncbi:MAG: hypothetical protein ABL959_18800 [Pyrinomonadaceae bacterium]